MKTILVGSQGYWGKKLLRTLVSLEHEVVEINLPDNAAKTLPAVALNNNARRVVIATPAETHFEIAKTALSHNFDVLIEKPLCLTKDEALSLCEIARSKKLVLSVDSTFVHSGVHTYLRNFPAKLVSYTSLRLSMGPDHVATPAGWDLAVHDIAILEALGFDEPDFALGEQSKTGMKSVARLSFGECTAYILAGRDWYTRVRDVVLEYDDGTRFLWESNGLWRLEGYDRYHVAWDHVEPLKAVVNDFDLRCKKRLLTGLTDGNHGAIVCANLQRLYGNGKAKNT